MFFFFFQDVYQRTRIKHNYHGISSNSFFKLLLTTDIAGTLVLISKPKLPAINYILAISYFLFVERNALLAQARQLSLNYTTTYIPLASNGVLLAALFFLWIDRTWAMYKSGWQVLKPLDLFQDYPENIDGGSSSEAVTRIRLVMGTPAARKYIQNFD